VANPLFHCAPLPSDAKRVLVIRLGALGDVVRTLPAVSLLRARRPDLEIDWLVEERARGPVDLSRDVDRVIELPRQELVRELRGAAIGAAVGRLRALARELRAARYDAAIDFHGIAKSALLARLCGARLRYAHAAPHAREGAWFAATSAARLAPARISRHARARALVDFVAPSRETFGAGEGARAQLRPLSPASLELERALRAQAAPIVLHPGTSAGASHKRWTPQGFAELARRLAASGERVLVAHGPGERSHAQSIVDLAAGAASLAPATETFEAFVALVARARVVVAPDSAAIHVAALVGTPSVQLLGPTDPVENAPDDRAPWRRVRAPLALPCAPCRRGCAAAACMRAIRARDVERAVRELASAREDGAALAPIAHR